MFEMLDVFLQEPATAYHQYCGLVLNTNMYTIKGRVTFVCNGSLQIYESLFSMLYFVDMLGRQQSGSACSLQKVSFQKQEKKVTKLGVFCFKVAQLSTNGTRKFHLSRLSKTSKNT